MPVRAPLIKGFLPVRLKLSEDDETFFYVKEHQTGKNNADEGGKKTKPGCTLFVINAPIIPGVSTKLALRSLLGRYADVTRVTVVPNPRGGGRQRVTKASEDGEFLTVESLALWSKKITMPTFLPPIYHEGKYAHVVFNSPKGLKKTLQELHHIMSASSSNGKEKKKKAQSKQSSDSENEDDDEESLPGLTMDRLEIQTLADETVMQYEQDERKRLGKDPLENDYNDDEDDDFEEYDEEGNRKITKEKKKKKKEATKGALAVAKRYRESSQALSRKELLAECNRVMAEYEKAEEAKRKAHQQAKEGNMVDDDGFVTVSYSSNTPTGTSEAGGIHSMLEESITTTTTSHSRRKAAPRRRNNNNNKQKGSSELQDFYRFQRKEHKKRTLDQLRTQFEEDLRKIKKLKEEHHYRPF